MAMTSCGGGGDEARNVAIPSQDVLARLLPADSQGIPGQLASVALIKSSQHFCSITSVGSLKCWGEFKTTEISSAQSNAPVTVTPPSVAPITAAAVENSHRCVVSAENVYCIGNNANRQVDPKGPYQWLGWTRVALPFVPADVATGVWASCAVGVEGQVACWGSTGLALLGENQQASGENGPSVISNLSGVRRVEITQTNACALEQDGDVMCWGTGTWGLLGGAPAANALRPVRVNLPHPAVDIDFADETACAALSDGTIWCWGKYPAGASIVAAPQRAQMWNRSAVSVDVLSGTTCAVDDEGIAWCWGMVNGSQRGWPLAVTDASVEAMEIEGSSYRGKPTHCIQTWNASVRCFGWNSAGELGRGIAGDFLSTDVLPASGLGGVIGGTRAALGATTTVAAPVTTAVPVTTAAPVGQVTDSTLPGGIPVATTTAPVVEGGSAVAVTTAIDRGTTSLVNVRVKKGKSVGFRTLVRHARLVAPKGAKIAVSVPKNSRRTCAVSGASIVGARVGACRITVKVTPKGSRPRTAVVAVDVVK
jgi:alpha-tubulin suppressor-like RCC1 family protein